MNQGNKGYHICIRLEFTHHNIMRYFNLAVGFEKSNDIDTFLNKEYRGIPFENDSQFIYLEVFDTARFFDTEIESDIVVQFKGKENNKVKTFLEICDDQIHLKFDGNLDIVNTI